MQRLILHIPHSSIAIPNFQGYLLPESQINDEILKLTDWYTDDLFSGTNDLKVKADFSRVFCDVERFADDSQEVMAQYGMGALYTKTDGGAPMREVDEVLRSRVMEEYYQKHHRKLSEAVDSQLNEYGRALIVDCHSFSDIPFQRDLNQDSKRPDFCIGTDSFHTPAGLIEESLKFFKEKGYSLGIDSPYSGTIVPMEHYGTNAKVSSIMLEINRKLYLEEGTNTRSTTYETTKAIVTEYLDRIRTIFRV